MEKLQASLLLEGGNELLIDLFERDAPITVANFCYLVQRGFYNGLIFHKVIPNVLAQTGCPKGDGTGNAGYFIRCELFGEKQRHKLGTLSMAHSGRDTASSQFFICLGERDIAHLDDNHTCFGQVVKGFEFLNNIHLGTKIQRIGILDGTQNAVGNRRLG
jgi:peptidyl-prolyl cis-trans isomerase B (cyclophilin B)